MEEKMIMEEKMRAAMYHKFHSPIRIERIPRPQTPSDGVVICVKASGVCRSDWHGWAGHDADILRHGLPFVPGHEFSGIIVRVGPAIKRTDLHVGARVVVPFILSCGDCVECSCRNRSTVCTNQQQPGFTMYGSFAEYIAIPRADRNVFLLPNNISFVEAAALGCRFTTAYRAVVQQGLQHTNRPNGSVSAIANIAPGSVVSSQKSPADTTIAIFGCGGVGLSCVMISKAMEVNTIITVDVSDAALEKSRLCGSTHIFRAPKRSDYSSESEYQNELENLRQNIMSLTNGGADICIDAAGFSSTCETAVYCTRRGGRMVQVGLPLHSPPPNIPMGRVVGWEIEIVGSHGFDAVNDMQNILELVSLGKLQPKLLVQQEVSLEIGVKALMDMDYDSPLGITMITKFANEGSSEGKGKSSASVQCHSFINSSL
jgi:alcohol dehydrogenase